MWYSVGVNVGYIPKHHHYKLIIPLPNYHRYKLRDLSLPCSCVLCCVSVAVADIWMMIYVLSLPVCLLRVRVPCVLRYGTFYLRLYCLYSVFYVLVCSQDTTPHAARVLLR